MALARPAFVVDQTTTPGTGTYTLTDPDSPGDGFRTLADAVADGHVSDGDTVYYYVEDTTTQGAGLEFEGGIGTVGSSGLTLARTTILQSSNSDNKVSWGAGGSRTVRIGIGVSGIGVLAAANTWAAAQTFSAGMTVTGASVFQGNSGLPVKIQNQAGVSELQQEFSHADASRTWAFRITATGAFRLRDKTAGLEPVSFAAGGAAVAFAGAVTINGSAVDAFPSGTRLLLGNNSVPPGWSIVSGLADKTILTTSTASEIDDTGGSWTISGLDVTGSTDGHALTVAQLPPHNHVIEQSASSGSSNGVVADEGVGDGGTFNTGSTGSGSAHSHTLASAGVSSTGAWRPAYYRAGWIEKS
jgi:hypothetical protein